MFELPVTSFHSYLNPARGFKLLYQFPDFHEVSFQKMSVFMQLTRLSVGVILRRLSMIL